MDQHELKEISTRLLPGIENGSKIFIEPLYGGGNNKSYLVITSKCKYFLKHYFRHSGDKRDRLASEYLFSSFVWNKGIRSIARPISKDPMAYIGVYDYVNGKKFRDGDIGENEIGQALDFFTKINNHRAGSDAAALPNASEACFSVENHIELVEHRIEKLKGIVISDEIDRKAKKFANDDLISEWCKIKKEIVSNDGYSGINISEEIHNNDKVISPSDFGFHNAVVGDDGFVRFVDFEYAGWDDPAKTVCDFFCQVELPVPMVFFEKFAWRIAACVSSPEKTLKRIKLLLPAYRIKWCCIVLNHFIAVDRERKRFASQDALENKSRQLEKAVSILSSVKTLN